MFASLNSDFAGSARYLGGPIGFAVPILVVAASYSRLVRSLLWILVCACSCGTPPDADLQVGGADCENLQCLACSRGVECASAGPFVSGTCCAFGDSLQVVASGESPEVVDVESDGEFVYTCGGFGGRLFDVRDPNTFIEVGRIGGRCQRVGIGPVTQDGRRIFWVAHHGDSRHYTPYLYTYNLHPDLSIELVDELEDETVLFEGLAYRDGVLYVAAHGGGVRVYRVDADGRLDFIRSVDGFGNAWKLVTAGEMLYVADHDTGLHSLSLADPLAPQRLAIARTTSRPRDVAVFEETLYLAVGGGGLEVYDVSDPAAPTLARVVESIGSVQAVAVSADYVSVASWTHFELRQQQTLALLATERVLGPLEQDVGVALAGDRLLVAEWGSGVHSLVYEPGRIAADAWVDDGVHVFRGDQEESKVVIVRNRGLVELAVSVEVSNSEQYSVNTSSLRILPGGVDSFELTYHPRFGPSQRELLTLRSNDPDHAAIEVPLRIGDGSVIRVGDTLDERLGFLDPTGAGQVGALDGHVVLLAYFGVW